MRKKMANSRTKAIQILKALSHPKRLEIIDFLLKGPSCVALTNQAVKLSQPNLSQHLKMLKDAGLIGCKKKMTRHCYYIIKPDRLKQFLTEIKDIAE